MTSDERITLDGFNDALIGFAVRCGQPSVAVYDYDRMIDVLFNRDKMEYDNAIKYIEFNIIGSWIGELTPLILTRELFFNE